MVEPFDFEYLDVKYLDVKPFDIEGFEFEGFTLRVIACKDKGLLGHMDMLTLGMSGHMDMPPKLFRYRTSKSKV